MCNVKAEALVNTMRHILAEVEAKKALGSVSDVKAKTSDTTLTERLQDVKVDKVGERLSDVKSASQV